MQASALVEVLQIVNEVWPPQPGKKHGFLFETEPPKPDHNLCLMVWTEAELNRCIYFTPDEVITKERLEGIADLLAKYPNEHSEG